nr:MAG TPA: hypothetical protein [Caudoviricetes sp.]
MHFLFYFVILKLRIDTYNNNMYHEKGRVIRVHSCLFSFMLTIKLVCF